MQFMQIAMLNLKKFSPVAGSKALFARKIFAGQSCLLIRPL